MRSPLATVHGLTGFDGDRFNIELFAHLEGRIWLYPLDRST